MLNLLLMLLIVEAVVESANLVSIFRAVDWWLCLLKLLNLLITMSKLLNVDVQSVAVDCC